MKLDEERISQALSSRFLQFAPISYITPQNRSKFDPIYYYRCVGQCDEAEDIAQDVFCRFYQTPPDSAEEAVQRAWLCRVAVNLGLSACSACYVRVKASPPKPWKSKNWI